MSEPVAFYVDFKSPYAYLAIAPTRQLERDFDVRLQWMPLTLNIPDYLDAVDGRSAHNWRKVRYAYMDARRLANKVGLTVRGPQKIYDTRMASIALMYARGKPGFDRFVDLGFERFFKRELDIENRATMEALLQEAGIDAAGFDAYLNGPGSAQHDADRVAAETAGVFGVPTLVIRGEVFWGGDRIELARERLEEFGLRRKAAS
ncbi:MAG: DsbA family protein [Reyranellaceae bacterium]